VLFLGITLFWLAVMAAGCVYVLVAVTGLLRPLVGLV